MGVPSSSRRDLAHVGLAKPSVGQTLVTCGNPLHERHWFI